MAGWAANLTATSESATEILVSWDLDVATPQYIELQYKTIYQSWITESAVIAGADNSYDFTAVSNIEYEFQIRGYTAATETWSVWSDTASATCVVDTVTKSLNLSGSSTDIIGSTAVTDTVTKTIEFSGYSLDAGSIKTTYAYYLADSTGAVYQYSGDYKGDGGTAIPCRWQSKETNFVDQYKELENRQKNVHFIRLYYVDLDSSTSVTVKISTDGGVTWDAGVTKSLGTGDGKNKSSDFFFNDGPVSGQLFTTSVETVTTANRFQLTAIGLMFDPGGEDFNLS